MASEITYAEVKFKNASNSSGTHSDSSAAPKKNPTHHQSKPGSPSLLFTSLMVFFLLLAISFLVAFIIYFQKYSQLLEEKKAIKNLPHKGLTCIKDSSPMDVWSCCPKDWEPFGSQCYFTLKNSNWSESKNRCSLMGAHLLVIYSQEEQLEPPSSFLPNPTLPLSSPPMSLPKSTDRGGPAPLPSDPNLSGLIRTGCIVFLCGLVRLKFAGKWWELEKIILSEVSQKRKDTHGI
ncbi:C-type lectin domain family 4 member A-like isoform X1 [Meriones unguiculatus]|uniref:C-type lectin domain family 4 member A-like isoform X1 n=1 Tax=Meriones unguiculatus TaxID=10047 RepID=UPI00293F25C4|nr:C-type lectin domain family 4 member A-like isoform X1 [Meriones unguiculatus]